MAHRRIRATPWTSSTQPSAILDAVRVLYQGSDLGWYEIARAARVAPCTAQAILGATKLKTRFTGKALINIEKLAVAMGYRFTLTPLTPLTISKESPS